MEGVRTRKSEEFSTLLLMSIVSSISATEAYGDAYLTDQNGNPQFFLGQYRFFEDQRSEWLPVLDNAQANGYNMVRALGISDGWIGDHTSSIYPYVRNGGGSIQADGGQRFNLNQFDQRFWDNLEDYLIEAESRGIMVVIELFGVSGPFGGSGSNTDFSNNYWHSNNSIGGNGNAWSDKRSARENFFTPAGSMSSIQDRLINKFLDYTAQRVNIIYQPTNEMFGGYDGLNNNNSRLFMNWIKDKIRQRDSNAVVLLNTAAVSSLPNYGIDESGYNGITIHAPYESNGPTPGNYDIDDMISDTRNLNNRNRFIGYDYDVGGPYIEDDYQDYQRKVAWTALTIGAGAYILLENLYLEEPWNGGNPHPDPDRYLRYLPEFLSARNIRPWEMEPSHDILMAGTATLIANAGEEIVAYLRNGGAITLDVEGFSGTFTKEWYNPETGSFDGLQVMDVGRSVQLTPPSGGDWVLHIRRPPTGITGAAHSNSLAALVVWPNPVSNVAEFTFSDGMRSPSLEIYEATGRLLSVIRPNSSPARWTPASKGVYFARLSGDGVNTVVKFVVVR